MARRSRAQDAPVEPVGITPAIDEQPPESAPSPPAELPPAPLRGALVAADLSAFMRLSASQANAERLEAALAMAQQGIESLIGRRLPAVLEHHQRQAVLFTASSVFLRGSVNRPPAPSEIPATARYYVMRGK